MNAHIKPPRREPKPAPEKKLILDAGRAANLAFSLGACRTAEEADRIAEDMELSAMHFASLAVQQTNGSTQMQDLELAGDRAQRSRLYRDRARELRS
jgi:hypothetical protein